MLELNQVSITIDKQPIINRISLSIQPGTVHALMGPNGSGKSTLAATIMGMPEYTVQEGSLLFQGKDITAWTLDQRARAGIFLAFQHPAELPGITLAQLLKEAYYAIYNTSIEPAQWTQIVADALAHVGLDASFASRPLDSGLSGGQKKRIELAQMLVLKPQLIILDEIDSGLDIDALRLVSLAIEHYRCDNPRVSVMLITHYERVLEYIKPDYVHVLIQGQLRATGDSTLAFTIAQRGYDVVL